MNSDSNKIQRLIQPIKSIKFKQNRPIVDYYYFNGLNVIGLVFNGVTRIHDEIDTTMFYETGIDLEQINFMINADIKKIRINHTLK